MPSRWLKPTFKSHFCHLMRSPSSENFSTVKEAPSGCTTRSGLRSVRSVCASGMYSFGGTAFHGSSGLTFSSRPVATTSMRTTFMLTTSTTGEMGSGNA